MTKSLSVFLVVALFCVKVSEACSCIDRGLDLSYFSDDKDMMRVKIIGKVFDGKKSDLSRKRIHIAKVLMNYKAKTNKDEYILITSPLHSCGVSLSKGDWLVTARAVKNGEKGGLGVYETMSCDFNDKWKHLSKKERLFLDTRMICDDDEICTCGDGSIAKMCKMYPCLASTCDSSKTCYNNYCGGCRPEWVDSGNRLNCRCMKGDSLCTRS